tara:strand:+ start:2229 stop:2408 length:180 start_codon:yes stop_codon:yes gene_type:complete
VIKAALKNILFQTLIIFLKKIKINAIVVPIIFPNKSAHSKPLKGITRCDNSRIIDKNIK